MGRDSHAAVCLWNGRDHSQLLITGGTDENDKVLSDIWILDLQAERWKEVRNSDWQICLNCTNVQVDVPSVQARCDHSATVFCLSPGVMEVTLFGGCPEWPSNVNSHADFPQIAKTAVLRFGEHRYLV